MNSQGVFAKGSVEVSAILEDNRVTSIIINDKNVPETGVDTPDLEADEFPPAKWNRTAKEIDLYYYKNEMDSNGIKAAIEWLIGEPVARLNMSAGIVRMESGDQYSVNPTQIQMFAIKVDGTIVKYVKKASENVDITGLTNGDVYLVNGYVKTVDDGKITIAGPVTKDYDVESAYSVSGLVDGVTSDDVSNGYAVAGKTITITITITFPDDVGYNILVDGDIVAEVDANSAKREVEVKVTGDVTITKKVASTDLATLLEDTTTPVINLEPGVTYTLSRGVEIEADKTINGNGATIETTSSLNGGWAFTINADNITLTINDVNFVNKSGVTAIKDYDKSGFEVYLYGCSFSDYNTSVQFISNDDNGIARGEIKDCEFNSKLVDISITGAAGEVVIEDNTYTENPGLENIGLGGSNAAMNNVTINDEGIIVHRYPS